MAQRISISGYGWVRPINRTNDLTIHVYGPSSIEPYTIFGNKQWLSGISSYFEGVLTSQLEPVHQLDLQVDDDTFFLRFYQSLLNSEIIFSDLEELFIFLYNAEYFGIRALSMNIIRYVSELQDFKEIYLKIKQRLPMIIPTLLAFIIRYGDKHVIRQLLLDDFLAVIQDDRLWISPEIEVFNLAVEYLDENPDLSPSEQDSIFARVRFPIIYDEDREYILWKYPWMSKYLPLFYLATTPESRLWALSMPPMHFNVNRPRMGVQRQISSSMAVREAFEAGSGSKLIVVARAIDRDILYFSGFPMVKVYEAHGYYLNYSKYIEPGSIIKIGYLYRGKNWMKVEGITVLYPKVDLSLLS